ncbi:MAG: hypothetical protein K6E70_06100 [Butyrivibrio sp.]|nr:hypothetical protein [Butyrivibrio sp.]
MELTGELKKMVEESKTREDARKVIEKAGIILTDDELDEVSGGRSVRWPVNTNERWINKLNPD